MFQQSRPMDTCPRAEENDGFLETLENLAKSMVSGPRDLRVAHRLRGTFNWEPWIFDGAPWRSLENKQFLQSASNAKRIYKHLHRAVFTCQEKHDGRDLHCTVRQTRSLFMLDGNGKNVLSFVAFLYFISFFFCLPFVL